MSRYAREQQLIEQSQGNPHAARMYARYERQLLRMLPDGRHRADLMQDTYLRMSRTYDGGEDFVTQFLATYRQLRRDLAIAQRRCPEMIDGIPGEKED